MTDFLSTAVELRVYELDGTTLRDTITRGTDGFDISWTDPLGEVASAQMAMPLVQAILTANPTLLDNAIIKVAVNQTSDTATLSEIFAFLAEGGEIRVIGDAEKAGEQRSLQCRGVLALAGRIAVYPEGGFRDTAGDSRSFFWGSGDADDTAWTGTLTGKRWKDVSTTSDRYKKPKGWRDKNAYWVDSGTTKKNQYLRTTVHVTDDTPVRIEAAADERLRVWLDSDLIIKNNSDEVGYTELNHWRGVLTAGDHTIAVSFTQEHSFASWGLGYDTTDRDRVILTCYAINQLGDYKTLLRHTNPTSGTWLGLALDEGERPPGWTAARIVGTLLDEAAARGVQAASRITRSFTDTEDSEGKTWNDVQEQSWPIGTDLSKVLADFGEHDVDWDMNPDLTLAGYKSQGQNRSDTVALVEGVTIKSLVCNVTPAVRTRLLVRAQSRWVQVADETVEDALERIEGFLQTGGSLSREQARHHGAKALESLSTEQRVYNVEFYAVEGAVPYKDFGKGDVITCPDCTHTPVAMRVLSLGAAALDDGPTLYNAELVPHGGLMVPFYSGGWSYLPVEAGDSTDYSSATVNDLSWAVGQASFGGSNFGDTAAVYNNAAYEQDKRIWLRRHMGFISPGSAVTVRIRVNNYLAIWWNGHSVYDGGTVDSYDTVLGDPLEFTVDTTFLGDDNVIAIRATDNPGGAPVGPPNERWYIDAEITVS